MSDPDWDGTTAFLGSWTTTWAVPEEVSDPVRGGLRQFTWQVIPGAEEPGDSGGEYLDTNI